MEVHQHTHPAHGKKLLKEYFWEFLMLFLAVFCGFLAEFKLEQMIENHREKKFASLVLSDLRGDSIYFEKRAKEMNLIKKRSKALFLLMTQTQKPTDKEIIEATKAVSFLFEIHAITATYEQMKASGSLRYLKDETLITAMQQYYDVLLPRVIKAVDFEQDFNKTHITPFRLKHFRAQDFNFETDSLITNNPIILNRTQETDQELLNIFQTYHRQHLQITLELIPSASKKLNSLINLLKSEYHLK